jgi:hypothetical protein
MTPGADSSLCLRLAEELCSTFSLCAKLIFHVATSMRLAAFSSLTKPNYLAAGE